MTKRIVSGIQPTGNLHLGNYLGAIRNWVRMQDAMQPGDRCFYFLADLHSLSFHEPAEQRRRTVRDMAAALIAAGVDPERSTLFTQTQVPAHAELCWLLNGTARMGWLNRMTQFKDKSGKDREGSSVALFTYPVLQAADVLLYKASHVPVGEDQKQHLELARDIATKFNTDTGVELFVLPEPMIQAATARIMSLRDGTAKMSKSDASDMSRVNLTDEADAVTAKIRKAKTDPEPLPDDPKLLDGRPEARNLVGIFAALGDESVEAVLGRFAGQGFGAFKPALAERVVETIRPIAARIAELERDPAELDRLLAIGAAQARTAAAPVLAGAYEALGLTRLAE